MYLSFSSGSICNVKEGLVVSMIDLITYKTDEIRKKIKSATLKKSHTKILFPKSFDEFEKLIINVLE